MSYAGILATVQLYKLEKADLTSQVSDILMDITKASGKTTDYMAAENKEMENVKKQYSSDSGESTDSTEYEAAVDEIKNEFNLKLQEVNEWEKQLETQKQNLETELQATSSYLESYESVLKDNVKKDSSYGGGNS